MLRHDKDLNSDYIDEGDDNTLDVAVSMLEEAGKVAKGGSGSGNFGHEGRPGEVGGSGEGGKPDIGADKPETVVPEKLTTFEGIREHLGAGTKIIMSAEKSDLKPDDNLRRSVGLKRILQNYSDDVVMQQGKWGGTPERSYIATVRPDDISAIRELAFDPKELRQDSIIVVRNGDAELHYANGNKEYGKISEMTDAQGDEDNYSNLAGIKYRINFKERKNG